MRQTGLQYNRWNYEPSFVMHCVVVIGLSSLVDPRHFTYIPQGGFIGVRDTRKVNVFQN